MTLEKQQTPLQKLIDKLEKTEMTATNPSYSNGLKAAVFFAQSLLPEEKQMVIDTYEQGFDDYQYGERSGTIYFNETYNETRPTKKKH